MATERNTLKLAGRYLIQDQDHMSEIRPVSEEIFKGRLATRPTAKRAKIKNHARVGSVN